MIVQNSGGLTQEEHGWLEDLHNILPDYAVPPSINPNKVDASPYAFQYGAIKNFIIPVCGYTTLSIQQGWSHGGSLRFIVYGIKYDGTEVSLLDRTGATGTWYDVDLSQDNYYAVKISTPSATASTYDGTYYYSLSV